MVTGVRPYYLYQGNQKLDKIAGYRYEVALAERKFEKLSVKVPGAQRVNFDEDCDYVPVVFDNLQLKVYWGNNGYNIAATATDVSIVKRE